MTSETLRKYDVNIDFEAKKYTTDGIIEEILTKIYREGESEEFNLAII